MGQVKRERILAVDVEGELEPSLRRPEPGTRESGGGTPVDGTTTVNRRQFLSRAAGATALGLGGAVLMSGWWQADDSPPDRAVAFTYEFGTGMNDYTEIVDAGDGTTIVWQEDAAIRFVHAFPPVDDGPAHIDLFQEITLVEPVRGSRERDEIPKYLMRPNLPNTIDRPWEGTSDTGSWWHLHWRATDEIQGAYAAVKLAGEFGCVVPPVEMFGLSAADVARIRVVRPTVYTLRVVGIAPEDEVRLSDGPHANFGHGYVEVAIQNPRTGECDSIPPEVPPEAYVLREVDWEEVFDAPVDWAAVPRSDDESS